LVRITERVRLEGEAAGAPAVRRGASSWEVGMAFELGKLLKGPTMEGRLTKLNVRADVKSAAMRMASDLRSVPTIVEVDHLLDPSEPVVGMIEGRTSKRRGLLVLTAARVVFAGHGYTRAFLAELPLTEITAVEHPKKDSVQFVLADRVLLVDQALGTSAIQFGETVRAQQARVLSPESESEQRDVLEVVAELRALRDAGVMTPEQFRAEAARLLGDL
jgi:hypothetical protein